MAGHSLHSRQMSASSFFPIRWTPVPVTIPVPSSPSCSQPRRGSYVQPRERCKTLISTTWDKLKDLLSRSHHSPVRRLELLAETYSYSQGCICLSDSNFSKDTGIFCDGCHGSNVEALTSNFVMDIEQNTMIEPKKSFERDWKEIRQRLERKIAAAAAQAISGRPGGTESRKPRWATPPKQKEPRLYQVKKEDRLTTRGANPRTGVISPSNRTDSSCEDHTPRPRVSQKWKVKGDQWISVDVTQTPSPQSSPLSYKLEKTVSSAGSGTTDISSSDDWEDRFVVHMPSAKDPNPPSMSVEQIRMYQEKMEMLHASTVRRHEMDASKQSFDSPQGQRTARAKIASSIPVAQKDPSLHSPTTPSSQSISPPVDGPKQYYFSPDEVGRTKVSPVNDNSKLSQKDLLKKLREECFLGCLGIDEAAAKNPDEILLFPTLDDDIESRASTVMKSEDYSNKSKPSGIPRSSKLPPTSSQLPVKPSPNGIAKGHTAPRTTALVIPPVLTAAHSTKIPKPTTRSPNEYVRHTANEDDTLKSDTLIATPTKKPLSKSVLQGPRTRLASKTSSRPRNFPNKSSKVTPEHDLFFESHSPGTTGEAVQHALEQPPKPISLDCDVANIGQIPEDKALSTPNSGDGIRLSPNDIFKDIPGKGPQLHEILSPQKARARNDFNSNRSTPKASSVAELDGFQVPQQLPSPPLSASPSPPPLKAKADVSPVDTTPSQPEKRNTHAIRMEIRMKAEKARQGAAAAKSASERLTAARKHAERLAEARAAYDKAKARSTTKKKREPLDELEQQKLNTEKINEARKAYKAAKAKEEEEAKRQAERRQKDARNQSNPSTASSPASQHLDTKPAKTSSRESGARCPSRTHTINENEESGIPSAGKCKDPVNIPNDSDLTDIASGPVAFYLSLVNFHSSLGNNQMYSHSIFFCEKLFDMAAHCFKVCKRLVEAWLEYKQTGVLPQSCVDEFGDLAGDIGQALVNFAILYCVLRVILKIIGYIAIVTNWIMWLGRPAGWIFAHILDSVWE